MQSLFSLSLSLFLSWLPSGMSPRRPLPRLCSGRGLGVFKGGGCFPRSVQLVVCAGQGPQPPLNFSFPHLSLSLPFFLSAGRRGRPCDPQAFGPPSPHVVFRKRLALGPPLTEVLYYWVGSRFSCSKRPLLYEPALPGLIPAPLWLPYDYDRPPGARC